jgi:hypothetical protein
MKTQIVTSMLALSLMTASFCSARADQSVNTAVNTTDKTVATQTTKTEQKRVMKKQRRKAVKGDQKAGAVTTDQGTTEKKVN